MSHTHYSNVGEPSNFGRAGLPSNLYILAPKFSLMAYIGGKKGRAVGF